MSPHDLGHEPRQNAPIKAKITPSNFQPRVPVINRPKFDKMWIVRIAEGTFRGLVEVLLHCRDILYELGPLE